MLRIGIPLGACGLAFTLIGIMVLIQKAVSSDSLIILSLGIVCWVSPCRSSMDKVFIHSPAGAGKRLAMAGGGDSAYT